MSLTNPLVAPANGQDRRRSARVPLIAKGQVVNRSMAGVAPFEVMTEDVSEGGLRLKASHGELLSIHDFLVMTFPRPADGEPIQYKAQVAWVSRPRRDQDVWMVGCSFFQTPPEAVLRLMIRAHQNGGRPAGGASAG